MAENLERKGGALFPQRAGRPGTTLTRHIARISAVFDAAPIGVGVWAIDGELLHANPVLGDLLGRSQADLVGQPFERFIDPRDAAGIRQLIDDVWTAARNYFECDFRCARPDGSDLWLRNHVTAVYGPGGRPEYLVSQIFSFASRRSHESQTQRLSGEAPVLLWLADENGIPRTGNARSFEFLGLPESSGELRHALFEAIHPDDYERHRPMLLERLSAREPIEFTARSVRHDGQWRWMLHRARPVLNEDGDLEGWAGASLDITERELERRSLEDVQRLFESVTEAGPLAVLRTDAVGRVIYANGRWADLIHDPDIRLTGMGWRSVLIPDHVDEIVRRAAESIDTGESFAMRVRAHDASIASGLVADELEGKYWAELRVAPVYDREGKHDGFVATIADITAEMAAGERADQLARVLDAGTDFLLVIERNGAVSYANRAAEEILRVRVPAPDVEPMFLMDLVDADSFEFFHEVVEPVLVEAGRWKGELTMRDGESRDIPVSALVLAHANDLGRIESISIVARDISDLKDAQWRMRQLATHDYLTGLPNRVMLYERLDRALARHHRFGQTVALLYLDLDRFKPINDDLGHHVGDAVLVELSDRIHAAVRDTDTPARIGGDEFAVLVEGFEGPDLLERVARRLIETISQPVRVEDMTVRVGVSIGIVAADASSVDADSLLARADAAMYEAKGSGRGRFVFAAGSENAGRTGDDHPDLRRADPNEAGDVAGFQADEPD